VTLTIEARNTELSHLVEVLKEQQARKVDLVAPITAARFKDGAMHLKTDEVILSESGVTPVAGAYRPTALCDGDLADRLGVPIKYLRRLRETRPDMYDGNLNGLIHGKSIRRAGGDVDVIAPADDRTMLFRLFRGDGDEGVARAVLSERYRIVDNLDVLLAALDGIKASGANVRVDSCDLTERRMQVRVSCPEIYALAPVLLAGYRSPFDGTAPVMRAGWTVEQAREAAAREGQGYERGKEKRVFAGFVISNSETGDGKFTVTPRLVVEICKNGLTVTQDVIAGVHLGGKLEHGLIRWTEETQAAELEAIKLKARDAVATFLDVDYVEHVVGEIEEKAGRPVDDPAKAIKVVAKKLMFSDAAADGILSHFIRGGQMTVGGVLSAVTSYAQCVPSADEAWELEGRAMSVLTALD
jgi:hypothetical protein